MERGIFMTKPSGAGEHKLWKGSSHKTSDMYTFPLLCESKYDMDILRMTLPTHAKTQETANRKKHEMQILTTCQRSNKMNRA